MAFMDINPLSRNHFLVIPTQHVKYMHEAESGFLEEALQIGVKVIKAMYDGKEMPAYNILQNNGTLAHQEVMHAHVHFIPKTSLNDGLGIRWDTTETSGLEAESERVRNVIANNGL